MKSLIKRLLKIPLALVFSYIRVLKHFSFRSHYYLIDTLTNYTKEKKFLIQHKGKNFYIFTPNQLCEFRASTFFSKEPETINWIEKYGKDMVLYDIGANIGLYSIYHSLINRSKSYAFEPSVFNLMQITKNININGCNQLISLISNPLSNLNSLEEFNYTSNIEGGALSSFGVNFNYEGKLIDKKLSIKKLGFSLDELVFGGYIKDKPNLIKIDVDGIEHLILQGARRTLENKNCTSVLVEINDTFKEQHDLSTNILKECGFELEEKERSIYAKENKGFEDTYNQIWHKNY